MLQYDLGPFLAFFWHPNWSRLVAPEWLTENKEKGWLIYVNPLFNLSWIICWCLNSKDIDMVQFTTARLREYGKDWELSRMWLCDIVYMIMASNEFDLNSMNLHLACPAENTYQPVAIGGGLAGLVPANPDHQSHCRVWASSLNVIWSHPTETTILKDFWTHGKPWKTWYFYVLAACFRCSASDTRDCGDILVRHLVKAGSYLLKPQRNQPFNGPICKS